MQQLENTLTLRNDEISSLKTSLQNAEAHTLQMEAKLRQEETIRRTLHNAIQELKGNIRVFCRVRPGLGEICFNCFLFFNIYKEYPFP